MSYTPDCGFEASLLSCTPEPSISVPLSRESFNETYEASVDAVPSADPEPASISVPVSRLSSEKIEDFYDIVPSADPGPASISEPLSRGSSQEIGRSCVAVDIVHSVYPEPASISAPLSRVPSQEIEKSDVATVSSAPPVAASILIPPERLPSQSALDNDGPEDGPLATSSPTTASSMDEGYFTPLAEAGATSRTAQLHPLRSMDGSNSNTPIDDA